MPDEALYQEHILDHCQHPRHAGVLPDASFSQRGMNPLCGDDVTVYAQVDAQGTITNASFTGNGCAISRAAASLLMEYMIGKNIQDGTALGQEHIQEMLGIPLSAARMKCAMLPTRALQKGIVIFYSQRPH